MPTTNKAKLPLGFVIAGKYRVTRELGRGGMAAVYEAENVDIGKRVAIKVLAQELTSSAIVVERFLREARAAAAIRSPYICDVYDSGRLDDGRPFLVLELLEGESLYERMTHERTIEVATTLSVTTQACRGLTRAHAASIVHRDLKPENLFLTKDEDSNLLTKILDFGLAKFYAPVDEGEAQARLTREGAVFGTPAYMSPEQVRGQGAVDHRADLWALACIVYECLTARTVWSTEQGVAMTFAQIASAKLPDPLRFRPDLPGSFQAWFYKGLHRDIEHRFQTAKELADELAHALHPGRAHEVSTAGASSDDAPRLQLADVEFDPTRQTQDSAVTQKISGAQIAAMTAARNQAPRPPVESSAEVAVYMSEPAPAPRSSRAYFAGPEARGQLSTSGAINQVPSGDVPRTEVAPPSAPKGGGGRAIAWLAGFALLGAGVYGGWNLLNPAGGPGTVASTALQPSASGKAVTSGAPLIASAARSDAGLPFRPLLSEAQQAIAAGDLTKASDKIDKAFELGGHGLPRTMKEHLVPALEANAKGASCKLRGLGRPRTYDLFEEKVRIIAASRPSIAVGPQGPVVVWTEQRDNVEGAWSVALDESLRARSDAIGVTPEGQAIGRPELVRSGEKFALTYWDATGAEAGIHVRWLDAGGRIAGPPVKVAKSVLGVSWPALTPVGEGFIAVWVESTEKNTEDLFARRLTRDLATDGDPFRITFLRPSPPIKSRARFPAAVAHRGALHVAFRLEREADRRIQHLVVPDADLKAPKVLSIPPGAPGKVEDLTLGKMELINTDRGRADQPSIACGEQTCFLAWNDEGGDGWAAYFEKGSPMPIWRKRFARAAKHPAVAMTKDGVAQLFWFEGSKVMTSPIDRDGTTSPSKIARVSGDQPMPSVAAGAKPGEWYVAWLDYEAGHLEPYVARVQCP
jgi:serine/threonine protein kinase